MEQRDRLPESGWLATALRRLERRMGADREGRTLWVWVVPALTVVVTFLVLAFIGMQGNVDLSLTIPMAMVLSLFLGALSAFYLTAASADERDADDGPGIEGPPVAPADPPPSAGVRAVVGLPSPRPVPAAEQTAPVGTGSPSSN